MFPDLFRVDDLIRFYRTQYEFLKIRYLFENRSGILKLEIDDKETHKNYSCDIKTAFNDYYMCQINLAIIDFLAHRKVCNDDIY